MKTEDVKNSTKPRLLVLWDEIMGNQERAKMEENKR